MWKIYFFSEENSEEILQDADAVCLCHSISDIDSLFESCEKWLSHVRLQAFKSPPVIIVGTKSDLITNNIRNSWAEKCIFLMSRYSEVASTYFAHRIVTLNYEVQNVRTGVAHEPRNF